MSASVSGAFLGYRNCLHCGKLAGPRGLVDGWATSWCSRECSNAWAANYPDLEERCEVCGFAHGLTVEQCREVSKVAAI